MQTKAIEDIKAKLQAINNSEATAPQSPPQSSSHYTNGVSSSPNPTSFNVQSRHTVLPAQPLVASPPPTQATQLRGQSQAQMVELTPNRGTAPVAPGHDGSPRAYSNAPRADAPVSSRWQATQLPNPQINSAFQAPQPTRINPQREMAERRVLDALTSLQAIADQINQRAVEQETAILEFKSSVDKVERELRMLQLDGELPPELDLSPLLDYDADSSILVVHREDDGHFVLTGRPVDLFKAEREARLNADHLRQRSPRPASGGQRSGVFTTPRSKRSHSKTLFQWLAELIIGIKRPASSAETNRRSGRPVAHRSTQANPLPSITLQNSVPWFVGAVLVRVGLDIMLAAAPGLWLLAVIIIAAPALFAAYRATVSPQSGFMLGYYLFLIMLGLLLGGRLI